MTEEKQGRDYWVEQRPFIALPYMNEVHHRECGCDLDLGSQMTETLTKEQVVYFIRHRFRVGDCIDVSIQTNL